LYLHLHLHLHLQSVRSVGRLTYGQNLDQN
jgi:hypothetical protein